MCRAPRTRPAPPNPGGACPLGGGWCPCPSLQTPPGPAAPPPAAPTFPPRSWAPPPPPERPPPPSPTSSAGSTSGGRRGVGRPPGELPQNEEKSETAQAAAPSTGFPAPPSSAPPRRLRQASAGFQPLRRDELVTGQTESIEMAGERMFVARGDTVRRVLVLEARPGRMGGCQLGPSPGPIRVELMPYDVRALRDWCNVLLERPCGLAQPPPPERPLGPFQRQAQPLHLALGRGRGHLGGLPLPLGLRRPLLGSVRTFPQGCRFRHRPWLPAREAPPPRPPGPPAPARLARSASTADFNTRSALALSPSCRVNVDFCWPACRRNSSRSAAVNRTRGWPSLPFSAASFPRLIRTEGPRLKAPRVGRHRPT